MLAHALMALSTPGLQSLSAWGSLLYSTSTSPPPFLPSLQVLSLQLVQIEPHGPALLSSFLASLPALRYLCLTQVATGFDIARLVKTGIAACPHLKTLEIDIGLASHLKLSGLQDDLNVIYRIDRIDVTQLQNMVEEIEIPIALIFLVDPWPFSETWIASFSAILPQLKTVLVLEGFKHFGLEECGKKKGFDVREYALDSLIVEALSR